MRQYVSAILISLVIWGCANNKSQKENKELPKPQYNEQQSMFCEELKGYIAYYRGRANDAQISDIDKIFENYLDSTGLFIGWKGVISNIKTETVMGHPSFYYEIKFNIPYFTTVTLKGYNYYDSEKEVQDSYIFKKIKNIKNGTTVYFDGIINRDYDGKVRYGIMDEEKRFTEPGYDFTAVEIYTSDPDSLSHELQIANKKSHAIALYTRKMINKEISQKDWNKKINQIGKVILENKQESEYNKRYSEALIQYFITN